MQQQLFEFYLYYFFSINIELRPFENRLEYIVMWSIDKYCCFFHLWRRPLFRSLKQGRTRVQLTLTLGNGRRSGTIPCNTECGVFVRVLDVPTSHTCVVLQWFIATIRHRRQRPLRKSEKLSPHLLHSLLADHCYLASLCHEIPYRSPPALLKYVKRIRAAPLSGVVPKPHQRTHTYHL